MAECLIKFVPRTVAPNVITLIGFMFNVIPHVLCMALYGTSLDAPVDDWFCYLLGVSYFIYVTFDNMDGKQARRTGTSSPLGLLFDHGCDCLTTILCSMTLGRMFQVGDSLIALLIILMVSMPFYFTTLEEYYTGGLFLPIINGVSDGSIAYVLICLATGIVGSSFWATELESGIFEGWRYCYFLLAALILLNIGFVSCNIMKILRTPAPELDRPRRPDEVLQNVFSYLMLSAVAFVVTYLSPTGITSTFSRGPLYIYGFAYVLMTFHIQLAHVTGTTYVPWRRSIWLVFIVLLVFSFAYPRDDADLSGDLTEYGLYLGLISILLLAIMHFIVFGILEISEALGIHPFSIKKSSMEPVQGTQLPELLNSNDEEEP